jgi:phosphoribosyl-AMP cyclohydrolase
VRAVVDGGADAVLAASRWHAGRFTIDDVKAALACAGVTVRRTTSGASAAGAETAGPSLSLRFDDRGLIPAVMQDAASGEVLMVAWMNREALGRTLADGRTWFWSRSREELWAKGETSGHVQRVVEVRVDCDGDTLLVRVEQTGVACHTGTRSCFSRTIEEDRC